MEALKNHVEAFIRHGGQVKQAGKYPFLSENRKIVGEEWATGDEAVRITYSHELSAVSEPKIPDYVVMPGTKQ
jgi:hypothetical protein